MRTAEASVERVHDAAPAVTLAFDRVHVAPGDRVVLRLRNAGTTPRDVTLAVMDDAVRALAREWLDESDPRGVTWLGGLDTDRNGLAAAGFFDWNDAAWNVPLPRKRPASSDALRDGRGGAGMPVPAPPPIPPAPASDGFASGNGSGQELSRVEVTGSRISAADIFHPGQGRAEGIGVRSTGSAVDLIARIARVRGTFADTVLWQAGIPLAPVKAARWC